MGSNELSDQDIERMIASAHVTLSYQVFYLRAVPSLLENPTIAPEVTQQALQELPQYIEKTRSIMDELREVEQYADERGIKIRPLEHLSDAKAVLETATIAVWGKLGEQL